MSDRHNALINESFDAWVDDMHDLEKGKLDNFFTQVDIVPLVCVWILTNAHLGKPPGTVFQFTKDFSLHHNGPTVWLRRACEAGDLDAEYGPDVRSYPAHRDLIQHASLEIRPKRWELLALLDGRPQNQAIITNLEVSLVSSLGHAAYNSADGQPLILLKPLRLPPERPWAFLSITGDHQRSFIKENELKTPEP